jgi:diguanylate cyclase (GGDEF)-like protein
MNVTRWQMDLHQLDHHRLFHKVALDSLRPALESIIACEVEPGEILLSPFSRNEHLYLILQGQMKVYLGSLENQPLRTLGPGECVGEISLLDHGYPTAYVVATEPCSLLRIDRPSLFALLDRSPELTRNLLELMCDRVRQGNRVILDTEQNANVDTLTGCFNRRWLEHIYQRESTRCAFNEQPLCMLMLDVDHFKSYNDRHGHLAGDYALSLVAHTLRTQLRPKDSMARYGGEEFVILLPEMGDDEARSIGERLRQSMEQIGSFYSPVGVLPGVTVSIGLAQMHPQDTLETLIARADSALYEAKQLGRNRLCG